MDVDVSDVYVMYVYDVSLLLPPLLLPFPLLLELLLLLLLLDVLLLYLVVVDVSDVDVDVPVVVDVPLTLLLSLPPPAPPPPPLPPVDVVDVDLFGIDVVENLDDGALILPPIDIIGDANVTDFAPPADDMLFISFCAFCTTFQLI